MDWTLGLSSVLTGIVRLLLAWLVALFGFGLVAGCQEQRPDAYTSPQQGTYTAPFTQTEQEAATQGSTVYVYFMNGQPGMQVTPQPGGGGLTLGDATVDEEGLPIIKQYTSSAGGSAADSIEAKYAQVITFNLTTGGTTPSLAGTTTAPTTVSAEQAATSSQALDQLMRLSSAVPISVALWGGIADAMAQAASGEGATSSQWTTSAQTQLDWLEQTLKSAGMQADQIAPILLEAIKTFFGTKPEATEPDDGSGS